MTDSLDFELRRDPKLLDSTAFIELGPGPYTGHHWQEGWVFAAEEAFEVAEPAIEKEFPDYDHFAINEIPAAQSQAIIARWRDLAASLAAYLGSAGEATSLRDMLPSGAFSRGDFRPDIVADFLRELADACEEYLTRSPTLCILGI